MQLLSAFLDANAGDAADTSAAGAAAGRQGAADDGKPLPKSAADDDADDEHPALSWLPVALPPPAPIAVTRPPLSGGPGRAVGDLPGAAIEPGLLLATGAPTGDQAPTTMPDDVHQPAAPPADALTAQADALAAAAVAIAQRSARMAALMPTAQPPGPAAAAPIMSSAGQVFAAAMSAVSGHARTDHDRDGPDSAGALSLSAAPAEATHQPVVQAVADAKHGALDLRDDRGLQGMIDRIEMLRDDADSRDTRIRLKPDALGSVDVAVRKDGDTIHVHFTAETQATRTLLTDAQPRLAELAEARGVKLGQSSVDAGDGGASRQQRPAAPRPPAPVAAAKAGAGPATLTTDQRLA